MTDGGRKASGRARASPSHEQVEARIRAVVAHISSYGWLPTSAAVLAEELCCSDDTIQRARRAAETRIANHRAKAPEPDRGEFIARVREVALRAGRSEDFKAMVSLLALEARVSGHDQTTLRLEGQPTAVILGAPVAAPAEED